MYKSLGIFWLVIFSTAICFTPLIAQEQGDPSTESINPLAEAVTSGDIAEVRELIEAGADVNEPTNNEMTRYSLPHLKAIQKSSSFC